VAAYREAETAYAAERYDSAAAAEGYQRVERLLDELVCRFPESEHAQALAGGTLTLGQVSAQELCRTRLPRLLRRAQWEAHPIEAVSALLPLCPQEDLGELLPLVEPVLAHGYGRIARQIFERAMDARAQFTNGEWLHVLRAASKLQRPLERRQALVSLGKRRLGDEELYALCRHLGPAATLDWLKALPQVTALDTALRLCQAGNSEVFATLRPFVSQNLVPLPLSLPQINRYAVWAQVLIDQGEREEALVYYHRAVMQAQHTYVDHPRTWAELALIGVDLGRKDLSALCWEQSLATQQSGEREESCHALSLLALVAARTQEGDAVLELLARLPSPEDIAKTSELPRSSKVQIMKRIVQVCQEMEWQDGAARTQDLLRSFAAPVSRVSSQSEVLLLLRGLVKQERPLTALDWEQIEALSPSVSR
jgi:tetratricopeptide (TPR) repeat protein